MDNKSHRVDSSRLTERQKREIDFYETYVGQFYVGPVCMDPISGDQRRPWNSYWYVYELCKKLFEDHGKRKLLDFGCGCGESSVLFAHIGYEVHGFDISEKSLELAKRLFRQYGCENRISVSMQVAEKLDYPSEYFDLIVGLDILHHVDIESSILECKRVLKENGIAIFREPVEVPVLDTIRNTRIVKHVVPNTVNYTPGKHITSDEKKINAQDIDTIKGIFGECEIVRFTMFSRFDLLLRRFYGKGSSPLEIFDYMLFKIFPFLKRYGGDMVMILKKN